MTLAADVRAAYDASGVAWGSGPMSLYSELAGPLLAVAGEVAGRRVLDVGTGAGAVAAVLRRHGADVVGCDGSLGMLLPDAQGRPPAVVGDALALPLRDNSFDLAVAGFVLNHLRDPAAAAREMARVVRPSGAVVATTFAGEAAEDVKGHLDDVAARYGWVKPGWYLAVRDAPLFRPTPDSARAVLVAAGLSEVRVERTVVRLSLSADEVLAWRWGMAHMAPFVNALPAEQRQSLDAEARAGLAPSERLDFPVLVMAGQVSS